MGLRGPLPRSATTVTTTAALSAPLAAPPWLPPPAVEVWREVEPRLRATGRLRAEHADAFAAWCCTATAARRPVRMAHTPAPLTPPPCGSAQRC